jgi:hypothetical protein
MALPAFRNIHRGVVDVLFPGWAGLAAGIVRAEPRGPRRSGSFEAPKCWWNQRAPAGRAETRADRLIVDALDLVLMAVLPRSDAEPFRPGVGVALALDADEDAAEVWACALE